MTNIISKALSCLLLGLTIVSCKANKEQESNNETGKTTIAAEALHRPTAFNNDDEFLDYIQKVHLKLYVGRCRAQLRIGL